MITVPEITEEKLDRLLTMLKVGGAPIFIDVRPEEDALPDECFDNVGKKVNRHGGERIVGWQFWKHPYMLEAELHAVWRSPDGMLTDITPKNLTTQQTLFVEDPTRSFDGCQVDNVRINSTANQLVDDFIALAQTKYYMFNSGEKADQKLVTFSPNEQEILKYIQGLMVAINSMLENGMVRNSTCFCQSGLKYKQCHGKDLIPYLNSIRE
jgi:hypothetical protein